MPVLYSGHEGSTPFARANFGGIMDGFDVSDDEGLVVHKGKFIEKNKDAERVQEKTCKRCGTRLTVYEEDSGIFRLWCMQCETVQKSFA